jgi:nitrite reductase/ring-hydroxylating ferredoxin subunit
MRHVVAFVSRLVVSGAGLGQDTSMHVPGRRRFLELFPVGGALGLGGCGASGDGDEPDAVPTGPIPAGNAADLPLGTLRFVSGRSVLIARDASGIYAMSAICTHAGCSIEQRGSIVGETIRCSCHGARFDRNGDPIMGPASTPLTHFRVDLEPNGQLIIQASIPVSLEARLQA